MKKCFALIWMIVCILVLVSCGQPSGGTVDNGGAESVKTYTDTEWLGEIHHIGDLAPKDFSVQYVRAGLREENCAYPAVKVFHSEDELADYLENETHMSDVLLTACEKYDAEYFKHRLLLAVLLEEGSGSVRHEVERIGIDSGNVWVEIKSIVPENGTCDMAYWHIFIEPEAGVEIAGEENVVLFLDGRNKTEKHTVASCRKDFANISVTLKDGWAYDLEETDSAELSINIYPIGQAENKIRIAYYHGFGVCGTGLTEEPIMLGGYEAWMGTYDNHSVWDFISLRGLAGDYVIFNEGGEKWWKAYGEEAMQILATLKVADGFITSSDAIKIARDKLQIDYDEVHTSYNAADGIWTVIMRNTYGDDRETRKITVDIYGNILDITTAD